MYQKKIDIKKICIAATLLFFLIAAPMYSQQYEKMSKQKMSEKMSAHQKEMWQKRSARMHQGMLCKASDLMGTEVKAKTSMPMEMYEQEMDTIDKDENLTIDENIQFNEEKMETIGKVENLIIDENQDRVYYVIVSSDNKNHPIPWWAFNVSGRHNMDTNDVNEMTRSMTRRGSEQKPTLYLNINKEQFQQAPTVDIISTVNLSDSSLRDQINSFYSQHVTKKMGTMMDDHPSGSMHQMQDSKAMSSMKESQPKATRFGFNETAPVKLIKGSEVIGFKLQNTKDAELGSIKDMVIDGRSGQVAYGLVGFGGFAGIGEKIAAVPWNSLTIWPEKKIAKIDATEQMLEAAILEKGNIDQLSQPQFARKIYDNFGAQPYWQVLGFVPGEMSMAAWAAGSEFCRNFNTDTVMDIDGTIQKVSTFQPQIDAAPGIQLNVKTSDGEMMTVYTAPQQYLTEQGMEFKAGDKIEVTGSKVQMKGQSAFMASEITADGKMLKLRDSMGKPLWTMEKMQERMDQYKK